MVGGAVAGAIMNEILRNDMMVYLQYFLVVIRSPSYVWAIITILYLHNNQQS